ncbi:MAG: chemotaxis protein CheD [Treponemataceae bacterium]
MIVPEELRKVVLHPGDHYATKDPLIISTLLGSCVAACLYDPVSHVSGMNHFLLADRHYSRNMPMAITDAGRYGVHAMELLINDMLRLGADRRRLKAKAFGGGAVLKDVSDDNFLCVGEVNERFIREFLKTEGIELTAEDLGGKRGRVIRFRTDTHAVYRKYIVPQETIQIEKQERGYWKQSIAEHDSDSHDTVIFT